MDYLPSSYMYSQSNLSPTYEGIFLRIVYLTYWQR